ncbi:hypothetical protein BCU84_10655 [Shewanella sp. 10N.286.51.B7]|uniref:hypothetical protein n=1 Tax=Shewanella sp. 10N.286.51.B7 TaxID=1880836 RepID=UPI000C824F3F|nr:hypothetical protein [Shewanella sp. 10N.286.51.B7]PMG77413.1 hypothetical protein BCU84_10655 [Shewanella sp. 10N.286.51.B7]
MTLSIVLMVLLCQLFTISAAFSVQYPHGEHPSGIVLAHHHTDLSQHTHPYQEAENTLNMPFNATESQAEILATNNLAQSADHEHSNQSLSAAHPPFESLFVAEFTHTNTLSDDEIHYQSYQFAPPIPPPHQ